MNKDKKIITEWREKQREQQRQEIIRIHRSEHARKVAEWLRYFNKK